MTVTSVITVAVVAGVANFIGWYVGWRSGQRLERGRWIALLDLAFGSMKTPGDLEMAVHKMHGTVARVAKDGWPGG